MGIYSIASLQGKVGKTVERGKRHGWRGKALVRYWGQKLGLSGLGGALLEELNACLLDVWWKGGYAKVCINFDVVRQSEGGKRVPKVQGKKMKKKKWIISRRKYGGEGNVFRKERFSTKGERGGAKTGHAGCSGERIRERNKETKKNVEKEHRGRAMLARPWDLPMLKEGRSFWGGGGLLVYMEKGGGENVPLNEGERTRVCDREKRRPKTKKEEWSIGKFELLPSRKL